jgi:hypothetical protein
VRDQRRNMKFSAANIFGFKPWMRTSKALNSNEFDYITVTGGLHWGMAAPAKVLMRAQIS